MTTASDTESSTSPREARSAFASTLKEGRERFLAHAIVHSLTSGRRTAEDFIRHFPPRAIMKGLEHQASLRASILVLTTGIKQKIALKKEWEDAATDLQIALDERETDAESIVELFNADDRVRYLDAQKIWAFLTEGDFWKSAAAGKPGSEIARGHLAFLIERALDDKLVTHRDIVEGATVEELANRLPKAELGRLIQCALGNAERGVTFTEGDLLATTPPATLVQHVPLGHLWDAVVVPKIAERHGYAAKVAEKSSTKAAVEPPKTVPETPKAVAEAPKAMPDLPPPPFVGKPSTTTPMPKDSSKVKLKQPEAPAKTDDGPGVAKALTPFGNDDDDIEVVEDDVQAV